MLTNKKVVFSGIQPTGNVQLGNYFGAIANWVNLQQDSYQNIYCIVDLHAITAWQNPIVLRQNIVNMVALLIASGIDTNKSILFAQSHNPNHAELAWIFNCVARLGWLNRMTAFKEKAGKDKEKSSVGLYVYPNLQAADILLYNTNIVPVGEDQKQHIELSRDIAMKFNRTYQTDLFAIPEHLVVENAARIMSLKDATKKMSKSDPIDGAKILLNDTNDNIRKKILKAKTDSGVMPTTLEELKTRAEIANLLSIYSLCTKQNLNQVINQYSGQNFSDFKEKLAEALITVITPIREKHKDLLHNKDYLLHVLHEGAQKALAISATMLLKVKEVMGFLT